MRSTKSKAASNCRGANRQQPSSVPECRKTHVGMDVVLLGEIVRRLRLRRSLVDGLGGLRLGGDRALLLESEIACASVGRGRSRQRGGVELEGVRRCRSGAVLRRRWRKEGRRRVVVVDGRRERKVLRAVDDHAVVELVARPRSLRDGRSRRRGHALDATRHRGFSDDGGQGWTAMARDVLLVERLLRRRLMPEPPVVQSDRRSRSRRRQRGELAVDRLRRWRPRRREVRELRVGALWRCVAGGGSAGRRELGELRIAASRRGVGRGGRGVDGGQNGLRLNGGRVVRSARRGGVRQVGDFGVGRRGDCFALDGAGEVGGRGGRVHRGRGAHRGEGRREGAGAERLSLRGRSRLARDVGGEEVGVVGEGVASLRSRVRSLLEVRTLA